MLPLLLILLWLLPSAAHANDELITLPCSQSAKTAVQRLQTRLNAGRWTILATVDQAAWVKGFGVAIPARTTIIFTRMDYWTRYLIEHPTVAIELPHKILVWEDREGVWVTRNTVKHYLRHTLGRHEVKTSTVTEQVFDDQVGAIVDDICR
jgi:uncharacterized protein (DUF302 family)